jgi:hypothetical protein
MITQILKIAVDSETQVCTSTDGVVRVSNGSRVAHKTYSTYAANVLIAGMVGSSFSYCCLFKHWLHCVEQKNECE